MAERALVVIPTYNERGEPPLIVPRSWSRTRGSRSWWWTTTRPTAPAQLADELAARGARVHVLHRPGKAGLGKAYLAGFRWALERGLRFHLRDGRRLLPRSRSICPTFCAAVEDADLVLGSRYKTASTSSTGRCRRLLLSLGANQYARVGHRAPAHRLPPAGSSAFAGRCSRRSTRAGAGPTAIPSRSR